ncbi:MAG: hypothetical protein VR64_23885 [Desulfatitalea sp. BRH_c12]|nr:MAG: hypothetical protein VR64_23885 [Desulfatitalea sp. BRH_c12]
MTFLVPVMLFGWVPLAVLFFVRLQPHRAVLATVIGGWLLLPMAGYDLPGFPEYSKGTAISLGLILGGRLSGKRQAATFQWRIYDLPMILWCLCPIPSSLSNQLGWYNGLSGAFEQFITWGVPYMAGRMYFDTQEKLKDLCLGIVIGGLVYVPLCLWEFRMSPRLSINLYGFFPHEWRQHRRYGYWRPIVFMQHGLMVALWMATSATAAYWLWRDRVVKYLMGIPMPYIVTALIATAVLCMSGNGWFTLGLGCAVYSINRRFSTNRPFLLLLLAIPLYIFLRVKGVVTGYDVEMAASFIFDAERVDSLGVRLFQEDLFIRQALENPLFGAGRASLAWPVNPVTGRLLIKMIDALWLINFSFRGAFGLITFVIAMLIGPWRVFRSTKQKVSEVHDNDIPIVVSLIVVMFMIDSLFNAMINPVYIMCSGALVSTIATANRDVIPERVRCQK